MNIRTTLIASSLFAASLASILASGAAHAALEGRDLNGSIGSFEAWYDTDLDITWLADANYAKTSDYDDDGVMNWDAANTWAASLSFTDGVNTYADWRLPSSDTCTGFNCTGSEMGHLFYSELGGVAKKYLFSSSDPDLAKFTNLQAEFYWSGSEYAPNTNGAWVFGYSFGYQTATGKLGFKNALAVSPGDVGAVPEADTWAMLLAGLGLVGAAARRRRA